MTWARLDDGFPFHPKFVQLNNMAAVGLWSCGLAYCSAYLTDGHIPSSALLRLCPQDDAYDLAQALVDVGLWDATDDGWTVHDYHACNPTAAEVQEMRDKRAEAGRKGGKSRAQQMNGKPTPPPKPKQVPRQVLKQESSNDLDTLPSPHPIPSHPLPSGYKSSESETSVARDGAETPSDEPTASPDGDLPASDFEDFWNAYPRRGARKLNKAQAQQQWRKLKPVDRPLALTAARHLALERGGPDQEHPPDAFRWLRSGTWREFIEPATSNVRHINGAPVHTRTSEVAARLKARQQGDAS